MSVIVKSALLKSFRHLPRGTTLIEVLVALLILSIGLLGLATLQSNGLKFNHSAYLRTQSTLLMSDIIGSMRANATVAKNSNCYVLALGGSASGGCNPLATADLNRWKNSLAAQLPGGDGAVARTGGGSGNVYTITVQWEDRDDPANRGSSLTKTFSINTEI